VVNARDAVSEYSRIRRQTELHPRHIQVLRRFVDDPRAAYAEESITHLRAVGFIQRGHDVRPIVRSVLKCSVADTAEGMVAANPFHFKAESDRVLAEAILEEFEKSRYQVLRRLLRDDVDTDRGTPPSRG
jgi:hypothetical protein